jgi:RNA polymerase sigma factor (sigma-70 family)
LLAEISTLRNFMTANPDTRESLILRLPSASDAQAWREFIEIYEPLLFRFARRRGLQDADAREVAQGVFLAVAKSVERWQPDKQRGRFRAWLFKIARNHLINYISKQTRHQAVGGTEELGVLHAIASPANDSLESLEADYRREMFRLAAAQVRDSFQPNTWSAFWMTSVLEKPVEEVAKELGLTQGAVYIARSRVIAKLKDTIQSWENDNAI